MPLTRDELDRTSCGTPNCGHDHSVLWLRARCHPNAGLDARYVKATGLLVMSCRSCELVLAEISVAER